MKASLDDFLRNGSFGSIELGMSRLAIEQHLGSPDDWFSDTSEYQTSAIWKYGDVEFYFQNETLWMIFVDDFSVPVGGPKIELDAGCVSGSLTCVEAERHLSAAGISYRKESFPYSDNGIHLITAAETTLAFCGEDASHITCQSVKRSQSL